MLRVVSYSFRFRLVYATEMCIKGIYYACVVVVHEFTTEIELIFRVKLIKKQK